MRFTREKCNDDDVNGESSLCLSVNDGRSRTWKQTNELTLKWTSTIKVCHTSTHTQRQTDGQLKVITKEPSAEVSSALICNSSSHAPRISFYFLTGKQKSETEGRKKTDTARDRWFEWEQASFISRAGVAVLGAPDSFPSLKEKRQRWHLVAGTANYFLRPLSQGLLPLWLRIVCRPAKDAGQ